MIKIGSCFFSTLNLNYWNYCINCNTHLILIQYSQMCIMVVSLMKIHHYNKPDLFQPTFFKG